VLEKFERYGGKSDVLETALDGVKAALDVIAEASTSR
jgi:hypothetical protein